MYKIVDHVIKVSVRNLVEFILRSGNIDNTQVTTADADAMQEGSRIHRKIQKRMGSEYQAEVPLSITVPAFILDEEYSLCVEGRADGIIHTSKLNEDNKVHGIIIQLPLPKGIDEKEVVARISPKKDIDCLTFESQGKLYMGEDGFLPCTPNSVVTLIKSLGINLSGKEAVVIGRSNIVGKPVAQLLLKENATVTICHSRTKDLKEVCKRADILVVAIGKPKFLDETYVKEGAVVIDVGTSSFEGKITGDVDFDKVIDKASHLTPVPGGVGALTTTLLIKNACKAAEEYED